MQDQTREPCTLFWSDYSWSDYYSDVVMARYGLISNIPERVPTEYSATVRAAYCPPIAFRIMRVIDTNRFECEVRGFAVVPTMRTGGHDLLPLVLFSSQ